jgi:RNA polymerase sigma-70 factor (ECF subfamily)
VAEDFGRFFEDHYGPVVRSLTLVFGDRIVAEDAAQGAFERAYRKWRSISRLGRPGTWIYVVALRDARRRLQRRDAPDDGIVPESVSFEEAAVASVTIHEALDHLALRQRTAVILRYLAGLSIAEVAEVMGCAEGTVKATLHTGLRRMRVDLTEEVGTDAG